MTEPYRPSNAADKLVETIEAAIEPLVDEHVSAGWTDRELAQAVARALTEAGLVAETPIDMVLFCAACGVQHIDAPDDAVERYVDGKQDADPAGDRETGLAKSGAVSLRLRPGGMATDGHAESAISEMRLSPETLHSADEDVHRMQDRAAGVELLWGQERQSTAEVQDVLHSGQRSVESGLCEPSPGTDSFAPEGNALSEQVRPVGGAVRGEVGGFRPDLQHLRQSRDAQGQEGAISGSLSRDRQNQGGAVQSVQPTDRLRKGQRAAAEGGGDLPREPWLNPPHRSHYCRPEDGGCGHIWRPADVATNGVRAVQTRGANDSPATDKAVVIKKLSRQSLLACDPQIPRQPQR